MFSSSSIASLASQLRRQLSSSMSMMARAKSSFSTTTAIDINEQGLKEEEEELRRSDTLHGTEKEMELLRDLDFVLPSSHVERIAFRPARIMDCSTIWKYLRAHAQYEGYIDEFELTECDLIRDGFGESPCFRCDVAEAHGKDDVAPSIIGYGMYSVSYCAWKGRTLMWENRYVHPEYRDLGIGRAIFFNVCKTQFEQGCRRISGYVDASEADLIQWYERAGMQDMTRDFNFHMVSGLTKPDAVMGRFVREGHRELMSKAIEKRIQIQIA